jgi:hypothetical protein
MYYLNAFNEMLRKRQRQNMMGGEGYQGVGNAPPSGPTGLGPAQDRSSFRDFYNNMSPGARFGLSMIPGVGTAFNIGRLANAGMSAYEASQLAPANAAMDVARQGFQASEKGGSGVSLDTGLQGQFDRGQTGLYGDAAATGYGYGPAPVGNVFQNAYEGAMATNSFPAERMGGTVPDDSGERLSVVSKPDIVSDPMSRSFLVGAPLAPMASYVNPGFAGGVEFGGGLGGFGSSSNEGVGIGERGDLARGGLVTPEHLHGPKPPGEDDGYTALQKGEYVITKAAVEKYGKRLLDAINNGTFR